LRSPGRRDGLQPKSDAFALRALAPVHLAQELKFGRVS
jgi:hypothetical protein